MKIEQVALQCFTIRDHVKDEAGFAASMKKVADIGYQAVQISAVGPIPAETIRSICAENNLTICATHEKGDALFNDTEGCIERLKTLGTKYTAYPHPHVAIDTVANVDALIAELQRVGEAFAAAGLYLTYHNHDVEFRRLDGASILERIYAGTTAAALGSELDTFWVQAGGGSTVSWLQGMHGRAPLLHLKDYSISLTDRQAIMTPIGHGNMDFKAICAAADEAGTEWFIVEQDRDWEDPFVAAAQSFDYIKEELCI
jgi:sugar phosphate isomerase/epimerase